MIVPRESSPSQIDGGGGGGGSSFTIAMLSRRLGVAAAAIEAAAATTLDVAALSMRRARDEGVGGASLSFLPPGVRGGASLVPSRRGESGTRAAPPWSMLERRREKLPSEGGATGGGGGGMSIGIWTPLLRTVASLGEAASLGLSRDMRLSGAPAGVPED